MASVPRASAASGMWCAACTVAVRCPGGNAGQARCRRGNAGPAGCQGGYGALPMLRVAVVALTAPTRGIAAVAARAALALVPAMSLML